MYFDLLRAKISSLKKTMLRKFMYSKAGYFYLTKTISNKLTGPPAQDPPDIIRQLKANGVNTKDFKIDIADYESYFEKAGYKNQTDYKNAFGEWLEEKSLEHYVSIKLLNISPGDTLIDIASCDSPFPQMMRDLYKCKVYEQDLTYPPGINGNTIGSNAAEIPVGNNLASALTLHCSFEHFEQNADSEFIKEAQRILKPGGRMCILPLYVADKFINLTDPAYWKIDQRVFDKDACVHTLPNWGNRFGRIYDIKQFTERVLNHTDGFKTKIHHITNSPEIKENCHLKFAALFEKI